VPEEQVFIDFFANIVKVFACKELAIEEGDIAKGFGHVRDPVLNLLEADVKDFGDFDDVNSAILANDVSNLIDKVIRGKIFSAINGKDESSLVVFDEGVDDFDDITIGKFDGVGLFLDSG